MSSTMTSGAGAEAGAGAGAEKTGAGAEAASGKVPEMREQVRPGASPAAEPSVTVGN